MHVSLTLAFLKRIVLRCAIRLDAIVEDSLDSLGAWLPVLLCDPFLLERALVNRDDDHA